MKFNYGNKVEVLTINENLGNVGVVEEVRSQDNTFDGMPAFEYMVRLYNTGLTAWHKESDLKLIVPEELHMEEDYPEIELPEITVEPVNVKEAVEPETADEDVILEKPVIKNKDAAYERKVLADDLMSVWKSKINRTDTAGLSEKHREDYKVAFKAIKIVIEDELDVVCGR